MDDSVRTDLLSVPRPNALAVLHAGIVEGTGHGAVGGARQRAGRISHPAPATGFGPPEPACQATGADARVSKAIPLSREPDVAVDAVHEPGGDCRSPVRYLVSDVG